MNQVVSLTREAVALTHRTVESLAPASRAYRVPDLKSTGLALRVAPSGLKTWDLAFRIRGSGKIRRVSLGRSGDVGLETARTRAREILIAARAGRDLIAEEKRALADQASRITVGQLIELYVRRRVVGKLRSAKEIENRLKRALGPYIKEHAADLRRRNLRELLDQVAESGREREAEKRRQNIGAMFRWALSNDLVEIDPTAGLSAYGPGKLRERALSATELAALWSWLSDKSLPANPPVILKLQILLGARCGEIAGLRKSEIDRRTWTWTLPASRSKNGMARVTPLVGLARQIVEACFAEAAHDTIFPTSTGRPHASSNVGAFLLNYADRVPIAKFTTHDLRRTFATMLVEMGISMERIAAVVGHVGGTRETRLLIRHYVRTDFIEMKTEVLTAWDTQLNSIVGQVS